MEGKNEIVSDFFKVANFFMNILKFEKFEELIGFFLDGDFDLGNDFK